MPTTSANALGKGKWAADMRPYRRAKHSAGYSRAGYEDNFEDPDYNYQPEEDISGFEMAEDPDYNYDLQYENDYYENDYQSYEYYDDNYDSWHYYDQYYQPSIGQKAMENAILGELECWEEYARRQDPEWVCKYIGSNKTGAAGMLLFRYVWGAFKYRWNCEYVSREQVIDVLAETSAVNMRIVPKGAITSIDALLNHCGTLYEASKIYQYCTTMQFDGIIGADIWNCGTKYYWFETSTEYGKSKDSLKDSNVIENEYNDHYLFTNIEDARRHQGVCVCCGK